MIVNLESSPPLPVVAPPLLEIRDLDVRFYGRDGCTHAVNNLSYTVRYGGSLAIIGASGSGKSVSCRAVLNLLSGRAVVSGSVRFNGRELLGLSEGEIRAYRGAEIAMVFQDTDQALNPTMRIGEQIAEAVRLHAGLDRMSARHRAVELLDMLKMPDPEARAFAYPHELSGGMRQRVMIAIALAGNPKLLIADEPTRALDVTTQAEILGLLKDMQRRTGMAVILVSHDLLVAAKFADDIVVMRHGIAVEYGSTAELLTAPREPYTKMLFDAIPSSARWQRGARRSVVRSSPVALGIGNSRTTKPPVLQVVDVGQDFPFRGDRDRRTLRALSRVSFEIRAGQTLGIVGETGSGKTTLARAILQIPRPMFGSVRFHGVDLTRLSGRRLREHRRAMQMVFQDPFGSLDGKWRVSEIVEEPLIAHSLGGRSVRKRKIEQVLDLVGLPYARFGQRRPGELSGGQCQRVAIARALVCDPELIVCDEAVSSLDVLIQAQVLDLFQRIRDELRLAYLFISHDLSVVTQMSDHVAVMYMGQFCEIGPTGTLFDEAGHPYTTALLASVEDVSPRRGITNGTDSKKQQSKPTAAGGCAFRAKCPSAHERCATEAPVLRDVGGGHYVACHFPQARSRTQVGGAVLQGGSEVLSRRQEHRDRR